MATKTRQSFDKWRQRIHKKKRAFLSLKLLLKFADYVASKESLNVLGPRGRKGN